MNFMESKLVSVGLFFLIIFLSGFWLNRTGKHYSMLIITIHKLIGLAMGIYLGLTVYRIHKATPLGPAQVTAIVVTILFFAVNVATGSLLSTNKLMPEAVSIINRFFPYLTVISAGIMLYLLN